MDRVKKKKRERDFISEPMSKPYNVEINIEMWQWKNCGVAIFAWCV